MKISIDKHSGFCFGVVNAIEAAELELSEQGQLYCLGDIVHNNEEVNRLHKLGMEVINHQNLRKIHDKRVLIRAHGEPPSTYQLAKKQNITLIDATCLVVLKLQKNVKKGYEEMLKNNGQVVIFGKKGHAEVIGLEGQTENTAIVISTPEEVDTLDFYRPMRLYAQTTQSLDTFTQIVEKIKEKYREKEVQTPDFIWFDTICRQVANREESLKKFASDHDVIIFVSGEKSSNGKVLFGICKSINTNTYMIANTEELNPLWFSKASSVGICGATSTPLWLMKIVSQSIENLTK